MAAAAAGEMVRGFAAATRVARPAAAVAAPPQPRRAVAARVLRTSASEKVAADLSVVGTNGSLSALSKNDVTADATSQAAGVKRKTKIVCTIGPSTNTREMIWKLAETGMNVARMNMSHGDHQSHQKVIDLVKEYNAENTDGNTIAIMLDTKGPEVRSGDVPEPIMLAEGQEFNFTIVRGVSTIDTVSVNYDDFITDVEAGDILLVDGGMMSLAVKSKTTDTVKCVVVDGGELKSRRHLNVRGKSATLPSITEIHGAVGRLPKKQGRRRAGHARRHVGGACRG